VAGIPTLTENALDWVPTGFCAMVAMAQQEEKTAGGLFLPDSVKDKNNVVEQIGRLVALSPVAFDFAEFPQNAIPEVGDEVMIAKLAGVQFDGRDGQKFRAVQDRDIIAFRRA